MKNYTKCLKSKLFVSQKSGLDAKKKQSLA